MGNLHELEQMNPYDRERNLNLIQFQIETQYFYCPLKVRYLSYTILAQGKCASFSTHQSSEHEDFRETFKTQVSLLWLYAQSYFLSK